MEKVDLASLIRPDLFQISCRESFRTGAKLSISIAPHRIEVVVLGKHFQQFRSASSNDVHDTSWQVACFEHLVEIAGNERVGRRGHGYDGVSGSDKRQNQREESKQRRFRGTDYSY